LFFEIALPNTALSRNLAGPARAWISEEDLIR
jgi:hypothetical protein